LDAAGKQMADEPVEDEGESRVQEGKKPDTEHDLVRNKNV
jgi:hypothetical protein